VVANSHEYKVKSVVPGELKPKKLTDCEFIIIPQILKDTSGSICVSDIVAHDNETQTQI
jgi:hypothetical protein